jgi:hypothetical protein
VRGEIDAGVQGQRLGRGGLERSGVPDRRVQDEGRGRERAEQDVIARPPHLYIYPAAVDLHAVVDDLRLIGAPDGVDRPRRSQQGDRRVERDPWSARQGAAIDRDRVGGVERDVHRPLQTRHGSSGSWTRLMRPAIREPPAFFVVSYEPNASAPAMTSPAGKPTPHYRARRERGLT